MAERFDDLYKKFEDLRQEYIVANAQMKRLEKTDEALKEDVLKLKSQVAYLQKKIEAFEKRL
ncbi:MAG TPA: hypothetical protein DF383_04110 [Deltaproteobacteria bacterium]|nr:hypothetical protein [Deltaproteobacteria bacterium]